MSRQALVIDRERGAKLVRLLHDAFRTTGMGPVQIIVVSLFRARESPMY